jgi:hypothetical protein
MVDPSTDTRVSAGTNVIPITPPLYTAAEFAADTEFGRFRASGTLCGCIDFVGPFAGCYPLTPDEALSVIVMLQRARADVLANSNPLHDPRLARAASS